MALDSIRKAGFRITMTRVQVIRTLAETHQALTAQDIHSRIKEADGRVDLVSVYRILNLLQEEGLIHFIGLSNGYIACQARGHHGSHMQHFVCRECGCVQESALHESTKAGIQVSCQEIVFTPDRTHIEIQGVCSHCA